MQPIITSKSYKWCFNRSLWINRRVIELFCAQVFGIRKGRAI
jgi:hypothetical protein